MGPSIRPFVLFPPYKQKRNNTVPIKVKTTYVVSNYFFIFFFLKKKELTLAMLSALGKISTFTIHQVGYSSLHSASKENTSSVPK
jgi:hypothetical protein